VFDIDAEGAFRQISQMPHGSRHPKVAAKPLLMFFTLVGDSTMTRLVCAFAIRLSPHFENIAIRRPRLPDAVFVLSFFQPRVFFS
jgi:hypothetical protein